MMLASFALVLTLFVVVGISSAAHSRGTKADYYLCSQSVPPAFVGLSAVATNNSGFMFIGLMGFTFAVGVASLWLMLGWILGDFLMSLVVHERLRRFCELRGEVTFAGVLARWWGAEHAVLRRVIATLTLVFLGAYAAAQLNAGGKALQALFGWDPRSGALMVAAIVAAYCLAGGIRASIWTDVAQSVVMFVAMGSMLTIALVTVGGVGNAIAGLSAVPGYLDPFPPDLLLPGAAGMLLFVVGWVFAGMSVIGQPHIMIRFMALNDPTALARARVYYYAFFTLFYGMAACVGMLSRLLLPELEALDPELALPMMAVELLPPVFVGVVIAGIFAATMSTADSLVLSCSSALTHDLLPQRFERPVELKAVTLLVVLLALGIALYATQSVFILVIFAWSALASAFGPLLFVYARGHQVTQMLAIAMVVVGVCTTLAWRGLGWQDMVYEGMPGMLAGLLVFELSRQKWLERALPERRI